MTKPQTQLAKLNKLDQALDKRERHNLPWVTPMRAFVSISKGMLYNPAAEFWFKFWCAMKRTKYLIKNDNLN